MSIDFEEEAAKNALPSDDELKMVAKMTADQLTLEREIAELSIELKNKEKEWRELAMEKFPTMMEDLGLSKIALYDGTEITVKHDIKASITKAKKDEAFQWLEDHGFGTLIKEVPAEKKVHPQTLMAFCREQMGKGSPVPTQLFGVFEIYKTIVTEKK